MGAMGRAKRPGPKKTWDSTEAEDRLRNYLRDYRAAFGYTQERLGEILGVSDGQVSRWESGKRGAAGLALLLALRRLFGDSADNLISGKAVVPEPTPLPGRRPVATFRTRDGSGAGRPR